MNTERFDALNVWEKGNRKRAYIRPWQIKEALGMKVEYYKTGNIAHASYDNGERHMSNAEARRVLNAGAYYDLKTNKWNLGYLENYEDYILDYFGR